MSRTYYVTYEMTPHPEGIRVEDVPKGHGATDRLVFISVLDSDDGGSSTAIMSCDGKKGGNLEPIDLFKAWTLLALELTNQLPPGNRRNLCREVFERIRGAILQNRFVPGPGGVS